MEGSSSRARGRYRESLAWLARAEAVIPLASQTFSKSRTQLPVGAAPLFAERADGCRLWDVDGNEYIDMSSGLLCVTLGYRHPSVDEAVLRQLRSGITLSLPHRLESEVAERIVAMVPSAEMVRFAKNGSDATSGAVRLARFHTGRDRVAVCGYHGWHDWYIGSTARRGGVPGAVSELTHTFTYNKLDELESLLGQYPDEFAAVILEPMNLDYPAPGFLEGVRDACAARGVVLIFDETITGFRFSNGGAQQAFGVEPDLATFGKGLANGMPLSAIAGRRGLMMGMEEIFFSGTFGGETLSLAAAAAVLDLLLAEPVTETLAERGALLQGRVREALTASGCSRFLELAGHPSWHIFRWTDDPGIDVWGLKTLLIQEMCQAGVFMIGSHGMTLAHSPSDLSAVVDAYSRALPTLASAASSADVGEFLQGPRLEPLFRVR
ncbi:MAG: aminotransferase class III-fold pyridoxal phosphate-dependent enzyme [Candidatus Nanopelagicales bacterium]|nr:aminotransferase class III-fold pyridoxal phosphate-dependent enzyme [Candidatus Nanopelagicales bacterium]MDZ4248953.1 aminotransferase class III-fold pyridoxal phosphate-dependent enzyme [Candidatus Nanopelagicales bacterium]